MTVPQRIFPTEDEVTREIAAHSAPPTSIGEQDQHLAAMKDAYDTIYSNVQEAKADGVPLNLATSHDMTEDQIDEVERNAVRMILAAQSVGLRSLCAHTNEIRPLVIFCDPPFVMCLDCTNKVSLDGLPEVWENCCDACGAESSSLMGYQVTLANLVVTGSVCDTCSERTHPKENK